MIDLGLDTVVSQNETVTKKEKLESLCHRMILSLMVQNSYLNNPALLARPDIARLYLKSIEVSSEAIALIAKETGAPITGNVETSLLNPDVFLSTLRSSRAVRPETILEIAKLTKDYYESSSLQQLADKNGKCDSLMGPFNREVTVVDCDKHILLAQASIARKQARQAAQESQQLKKK